MGSFRISVGFGKSENLMGRPSTASANGSSSGSSSQGSPNSNSVIKRGRDNGSRSYEKLRLSPVSSEGEDGDAVKVQKSNGEYIVSREEAKRFSMVGRKDFERFESVGNVAVKSTLAWSKIKRVNGGTVNVLEGLELDTRVFSGHEQKRVVDFVYELQKKGRNDQLRGNVGSILVGFGKSENLMGRNSPVSGKGSYYNSSGSSSQGSPNSNSVIKRARDNDSRSYKKLCVSPVSSEGEDDDVVKVQKAKKSMGKNSHASANGSYYNSSRRSSRGSPNSNSVIKRGRDNGSRSYKKLRLSPVYSEGEDDDVVKVQKYKNLMGKNSHASAEGSYCNSSRSSSRGSPNSNSVIKREHDNGSRSYKKLRVSPVSSEAEDDDVVKVQKANGEYIVSREEAKRFLMVGRKKDFVRLERVNGRTVNVLEGLELHTRVFSDDEQKRVVDFVYELEKKGQRGQLRERTYSKPRKWMRGKGRVTIQFGCCYNYAMDKKGNPPGIIRDEEVDPIPPFILSMIRRMVKWHVLPPTCIPNSCIINIYDEGDCIPPHIDHHDFMRPFCTASFLSKCDILFGSKLKILGPGYFSGSMAIPLPVGSVLILKGNGADVAKHCVPGVPAKRISITFRKMDDSKLPHKFSLDPALQDIPLLPSSSRLYTQHFRTPVLSAPQVRTPVLPDQWVPDHTPLTQIHGPHLLQKIRDSEGSV